MFLSYVSVASYVTIQLWNQEIYCIFSPILDLQRYFSPLKGPRHHSPKSEKKTCDYSKQLFCFDSLQGKEALSDHFFHHLSIRMSSVCLAWN